MKPTAFAKLGLLLLLLLLAALALYAQPGAIAWPQPAAERRNLALLSVLIYALFCALLAWRHRRKRPVAATAAGEGGVLIVHASQTGHAEQLAERSLDSLRSAGLAAELLALGELDAARLRRQTRILFLVSTTGEGDAPDPAFRFLKAVMAGRPELVGLQYGLLALGDSSYQHYCGFGRALDGWLRGQGAQPLFERIEVDNGDAAALWQWQQQLGRLAGDVGMAAWTEPEFGRWRLVERRLLNPGSLGGPAYHLAFAPLAALPGWQAGDIAEVRLPQDATGTAAQQRDYSIASLPADGHLELLVRAQRDAQGRLGRGSGWLCVQAQLGEEIALRIRSNPGFHLPTQDFPLILIGNGTGLAGLRALLKARAAAAQSRNWLLFGERSAAHDRFHREEIERWQADGLLARVDLAFSRDQAERVYVQQRLQQAGGGLRRWVAQGAAIYVCGSAQGMAPAVDAVLREQLGAGLLNELLETGRYRRDVY